jgi:hypothetical protein
MTKSNSLSPLVFDVEKKKHGNRIALFSFSVICRWDMATSSSAVVAVFCAVSRFVTADYGR